MDKGILLAVTRHKTELSGAVNSSPDMEPCPLAPGARRACGALWQVLKTRQPAAAVAARRQRWVKGPGAVRSFLGLGCEGRLATRSQTKSLHGQPAKKQLLTIEAPVYKRNALLIV